MFHKEWVLRSPGLGIAWDRKSDVTFSMLRLCKGLWRRLGELSSPVPAPLLSRAHDDERLWRLLSENRKEGSCGGKVEVSELLINVLQGDRMLCTFTYGPTSVWRRPCAWKVVLSHSCTINLAPSVN